jgi:serine acetyltransferase
VVIGANAVVLTQLTASLRIGTGAKVGAGAVVVQDVRTHATVTRVPAAMVRQRPVPE